MNASVSCYSFVRKLWIVCLCVKQITLILIISQSMLNTLFFILFLFFMQASQSQPEVEEILVPICHTLDL